MSGRGSEAKWPKRAGWARTSSAAYSLTSRVSARAAVSSPKWVPGEEMDSSEVRMRCSSMSRRCSHASQEGQPGMPSGWMWPAARAAAT